VTRCARGQVPLSAVEAAIGVVLVLGVVSGFALGVPEPDRRSPQLDAYAEDAVTILATEPPRHDAGTRLAEVVRSASAFEAERAALQRRVDGVLPANVLFRVETSHGAVGHPKPNGVETGVATTATQYGRVTIRTWYA
jgi:hypothetical protein